MVDSRSNAYQKSPSYQCKLAMSIAMLAPAYSEAKAKGFRAALCSVTSLTGWTQNL